MPSTNKKACEVCSLILEENEFHTAESVCIKAMKEAMKKQRKAADQLGMAISTRFLAVLEELCIDPDAGIPYEVMMPGDTMPRRLVASEVQGVFETILDKYKKMGDWSPLTDAQNRLHDEEVLTYDMRKFLKEVSKHYRLRLPIEMREELKRLLER